MIDVTEVLDAILVTPKRAASNSGVGWLPLGCLLRSADSEPIHESYKTFLRHMELNHWKGDPKKQVKTSSRSSILKTKQHES